MKPKERYEKALRLLDELKEERAPLIVEGKKDTRALATIGITNVIELNKGKNLADFAHSVDEKEVIILTDYDRTGGKLKKELKELFLSQNTRVNTEYRRQLRYLTGVKYIENLDKVLNTLKREASVL